MCFYHLAEEERLTRSRTNTRYRGRFQRFTTTRVLRTAVGLDSRQEGLLQSRTTKSLAPNELAELQDRQPVYCNHREETGRWANEFEYCRGKCRTHKFSTVHENAYLAPDIHCYSDLGELPANHLTNGRWIVIYERFAGPDVGMAQSVSADTIPLHGQPAELPPPGKASTLMQIHHRCHSHLLARAGSQPSSQPLLIDTSMPAVQASL